MKIVGVTVGGLRIGLLIKKVTKLLVCDRCGIRIDGVASDTKKSITLYNAPKSHFGRTVDLCEKCLSKRKEFIGMAESYFMNNDNPNELFENVKYWNAGW